MKYPKYVLSTCNNTFLYESFSGSYEEKNGSFLKVEEDEQKITITVDRFSTVPFYYIVHKSKLYGATKLGLLLESLPVSFQRKLNINAAIPFLYTNTLLGQDTLIDDVHVIPYGCSLVYDKRTENIKIERYWNLPGFVKEPVSENILIDDIKDSFQSTIRLATSKFQRVGMNLSGGMDSRQIFFSLLNEIDSFNCYTYGANNNLDTFIAKMLSDKYKVEHYFFPWNGVESFKLNSENFLNLTNAQQSILHGHGIEIHDFQCHTSDVIVYGHFLDFFINGHMYNRVFDNYKKNVTELALQDLFFNGPCAVINAKAIEKDMLYKGYQGLYSERIKREVSVLDHMEPEKRYDSLYFIHHGLRRLLPQAQSGAHYLDFYLPALQNEFFDICWSVPGHLRRNRELQRKLILAINEESFLTPVVKDNVGLVYLGENKLKRAFTAHYSKIQNKLDQRLRKGTYYNGGMRRLMNEGLYSWFKNTVLNSSLKELGFINPNYIDYLFSSKSEFRQNIPNNHYGAIMTLALFCDRYL